MKGNKRVVWFSAVALLLGGLSASVEAQQPTLRRTVRLRQGEGSATADTLSQRVRLHNLDLSQDTERASWLRTIYRQLDLSKEANAPLYYPTKTTEQAQSLFAKIFKLVAADQIKVYEYLDGEEVFTPEYKVKFKDLLDRFRINYTESKGSYHVADADIPTSEVKAYYLKETWYFDAATSTYDVKIDAICPILYDLGDYGEVAMPLFWLPFDEVKPFISDKPVMLSSYNNKPSATLDDFFRLGMYDGQIIKTKNLLNRALSQYITDPDSLKVEQERIELQLKDFKKKLFVACVDTRVDTLTVNMSVPPRDVKGANSRDKRVRSAKNTVATKTKVKSIKAAKTSKVKPATTGGRSVRGRI